MATIEAWLDKGLARGEFWALSAVEKPQHSCASARGFSRQVAVWYWLLNGRVRRKGWAEKPM